MLTENDKNAYFAQALRLMSFAQRLGMEVKEIQQDKVVLEMPVIAEHHANLLGVVHGGVLMSLADTAMGFACANAGSLPTTIDMNINFIKSISIKGSRFIRVSANVLHHGQSTLVAEAEVYSDNGELAAKARGTFFIVGKTESLVL